MLLTHPILPCSLHRLALAALLALPALWAVACGEDDPPAGSGNTASACESKAYCYEVVGGLSADDQAICKQLGSTVLPACDPSKAVRKCTQVTQVSEDNGPTKDVTYVYYFREGDTTGCLGTEEKLK